MVEKKAFVVYFEIYILVIAIFSFSYLLHATALTSNVSKNSNNDLNKNSKNILFSILKIIFGNEMIPMVSAADSLSTMSVCCARTTNGSWCYDTNPQNCDKNYPVYTTNCSSVDTGYCEKGCCQSNYDGGCYDRSSNASCFEHNGTFFPGDEECGGASCRKGCCQLGGADAKLLNEKACKFYGNTQNPNLPTNWVSDITNEIKCMYSVTGNKKGACMFYSGGNKTCVYTTLDDCVSRTGNETSFDVNGKYCSDPSLNTSCKAHDHRGCVEGKEDVYYFDSCGNTEEISKDCNLFNGTYCGKDSLGTYICKSIDCVINGVTRKNGESWCTYDNVIGMGKDPAGSRHIRHVCYMGTERIEPCADYRNQICVGTTSTASDGSEFSQASCRVNNWRKCLELNSKKSTDQMIEQCKKNPDCWVKHIDMGGSFKFDVCVPQYPPGFSLYDESDDLSVTDMGDAICSIGTQRCTETWVCTLFGCFCVDNCDCSKKKFSIEMNELCMSLGDCGAWINYIDVFTSGGMSTKKAGKHGANPGVIGSGDIASYKAKAGPKPAKPGNFEFLEGINAGNLRSLDSFNQPGSNDSQLVLDLNSNLSKLKRKMDLAKSNMQIAADANNVGEMQKYSAEFSTLDLEYHETLERLEKVQSNQNRSALQAEIEKLVGSMGSPLLLYMISHDNASEPLDEFQAGMINANPTTAGSFFNAFSSVRSAISGQIVQQDRKAGGFEMIAALIAGLIAYLIFESILLAFVAALMAYLFFMAWIVYVHIDFTCSMWERPSGNADCNKCNDPFIPCTEYRCQSLGELCKFINKGTASELCYAMEANSSLPVIQPLESVITPGYKYTDISESGFKVRKDDGNCVDPFNTIHIGIKVDPFAKCRFDTDATKKWEDMTYEFGFKGNHVLPSHQLDLFFPSPEAVRRSFGGGMICNTTEHPCTERLIDGKKTVVCPQCNLTNEEIEKLTKTEIFVKCKTADGRQNPTPYGINTCVNPGPDLSPPIVRVVTPDSGSYIKYNQTNQSIVVYVSEPSQCRWTTRGSSVTFGDMENELTCFTNVDDAQAIATAAKTPFEQVHIEYGYPCFGDINVSGNSKFWIRCQDLSEARNNMSQSIEYQVKLSETPLNITDFRPIFGDQIISGTDPTSIVFKVETEGGAQDGASKCEYQDANIYYIHDLFKENYTDLHELNWTLAYRGDWNITFSCWDIAGNRVNKSTFFTINIDDSGPKIVRIFNFGSLKVFTSENAECKYSSSKNFDYDNATLMSSNNGFEHTGSWSFNIKYYIECKDSFGNPGPRIVATPFESFVY